YDYTPTTQTLTFSNGDAAKLFTVQLSNDTVTEVGETFLAVLSGAATGSPATGTGTIIDPANVTFSITPTTATATEGSPIAFTVSRNFNPGSTQTVVFSTGEGTAHSSGTAAAGTADFTATNTTLTFAPGVTSTTVTVATANDTVFEGTENFS